MIKSIPLNKLVQSPRNVRRHSDPAADAELKASIAAHGLLQNLIVRSAAKGRFEVEAGERRRRAMLALADEKILARDHEITCLVLEDSAEAAVETSLAENFHRLAMLGHVSRVSFDRKDYRAVCLFQAARSAYPKSWR
ncbi:ParB/Srx family N-terminal domain-containing protein, partial [Sphingobium fuliginis]|uniref:ParB/Srx family N-terminal domain-containing protein n=1 Tax=Sphingobium fuliginis (strain ATCC 27551) TaxID=336203 RepID=UPI0037CA4F5B